MNYSKYLGKLGFKNKCKYLLLKEKFGVFNLSFISQTFMLYNFTKDTVFGKLLQYRVQSLGSTKQVKTYYNSLKMLLKCL